MEAADVLGPQPAGVHSRHPEVEAAEARAAGPDVTDLRMERLQVECFDIGAVVYFLRKVIRTVPDFSVERHRERLRELHRRNHEGGAFAAHSTRVLVDVRRPVTR